MTTTRPEAIQILLRSRFELGISWTVLLRSSVTEWTEGIDLYAENTHYLETNRKIVQKGWFANDARFGLVSDIQVCKTIGRYRVEVKVPSALILYARALRGCCPKSRGPGCSGSPRVEVEDQTTPWIRLVSGVEKYVRETMPIQEEERASGRPAAKARPILKPSSASNQNFIPVRERKRNDIEVQKSRDHYCFQMSKFMTQLL